MVRWCWLYRPPIPTQKHPGGQRGVGLYRLSRLPQCTFCRGAEQRMRPAMLWIQDGIRALGRAEARMLEEAAGRDPRDGSKSHLALAVDMVGSPEVFVFKSVKRSSQARAQLGSGIGTGLRVFLVEPVERLQEPSGSGQARRDSEREAKRSGAQAIRERHIDREPLHNGEPCNLHKP